MADKPQVWSDEKLIIAAEALAAHWSQRDSIDWFDLSRDVLKLLRDAAEAMRDAPAAQAEWEPVGDVTHGRMGLHADDLAVTIGEGDMALATFAWPDDGYEYAIMRRRA